MNDDVLFSFQRLTPNDYRVLRSLRGTSRDYIVSPTGPSSSRRLARLVKMGLAERQWGSPGQYYYWISEQGKLRLP